jgi:hypothetical protein
VRHASLLRLQTPSSGAGRPPARRDERAARAPGAEDPARVLLLPWTRDGGMTVPETKTISPPRTVAWLPPAVGVRERTRRCRCPALPRHPHRLRRRHPHRAHPRRRAADFDHGGGGYRRAHLACPPVPRCPASRRCCPDPHCPSCSCCRRWKTCLRSGSLRRFRRSPLPQGCWAVRRSSCPRPRRSKRRRARAEATESDVDSLEPWCSSGRNR